MRHVALVMWFLLAWGCGGNDVVGVETVDGRTGDDDAFDARPPRDGAAPDAIPPDAAVEPSPWQEIVEPRVDLEGGTGDIGHDGSAVRLHARHAIRIDTSIPLAPTPALPPLPVDGVVVSSGDELAADLTRVETILLRGALAASGPGAERVITSTEGDVVVEGDLRAADAQGLVLRAPAGTVYLAGSVDLRGTLAAAPLVIEAREVVIGGVVVAAGQPRILAPGGDGGAVTIRASAGAIVVAGGGILAAGGDGAPGGGRGGAVDLQAAGGLVVAAPIDTLGGNGRGADVTGGAGGALVLRAGGELQIGATVRLRGGAAVSDGARAAGGDAGALTIDAGGTVRIGAIVDGRGGLARADLPGDAVTGGAPTALAVGDSAPPAEIDLEVPLRANGGGGDARGGHGAPVTLVASDGDLVLAARVEVDGGDARLAPGNAGTVRGNAGPTGGGVVLAAVVSGTGGSATGGEPAPGGAGADVTLEALSRDGALTVTTTGSLQLDGGDASGAAPAGDAGDIAMISRDGDASMAGLLRARGGAAPGGTGGSGGHLELFTDANFDGIGGDLTIEPEGVIDVSGGAGAVGGSAHNDGGAGVALFPDHQDQIAVLLNSDGMHGGPQNGVLKNLGHVIARGGPAGGSGGDVMFHGRQDDPDLDPAPGAQDLSGDGSGRDGNFAAE